MAIDAVMRRQLRIVNFALGGNHYGMGNIPPSVEVAFTPGVLVIRETARQRKRTRLGSAKEWSWTYQEIREAQVFRLTWYNALGAIDRHKSPLGVRLDMGESRLYVLLYTDEIARLLEALESHGVTVDRAPRRLNRLLIGRK